jgi:hypothetical protein
LLIFEKIIKMNRFEAAREKYQPSEIKYLLIAETPPKSNSNRFFYFERVDKYDTLFIQIMKCLYPAFTEKMSTSEIRTNKKRFLKKFMGDGFYLIDSLDDPFEDELRHSAKVRLIKAGQNNLIEKIRHISSPSTKIMLIAATVFEANNEFLLNHKINVINKEFIDFPLYRGVENFKKKLTQVLLQ